MSAVPLCQRSTAVPSNAMDPRTYVRSTVARARGGVGPTRGITVIAAPGAAAAAVMPGVRSTPGRPGGGDVPGRAPAKPPETAQPSAEAAARRQLCQPGLRRAMSDDGDGWAAVMPPQALTAFLSGDDLRKT